MSTSVWAAVIARITPSGPTDLDAALDTVGAQKPKAGKTSFPPEAANSPLIVEFEEEETVCFGARITKDTPNKTALAMTLAQMADEKAATPIILSHVDICGLERFGFRVERITGETAEEIEACEAQVRDFWNIVLVI